MGRILFYLAERVIAPCEEVTSAHDAHGEVAASRDPNDLHPLKAFYEPGQGSGCVDQHQPMFVFVLEFVVVLVFVPVYVLLFVFVVVLVLVPVYLRLCVRLYLCTCLFASLLSASSRGDVSTRKSSPGNTVAIIVTIFQLISWSRTCAL